MKCGHFVLLSSRQVGPVLAVSPAANESDTLQMTAAGPLESELPRAVIPAVADDTAAKKAQAPAPPLAHVRCSNTQKSLLDCWCGRYNRATRRHTQCII